jgi:hypothetical protein
MGKNNWSCTACGMSSGRRTSVQRHIDNPNIHGGSGRAVSFTEYSAGLTAGRYQVGQKPRFAPLEKTIAVRLVNKIRSEVEDHIAREVAMRICKTLIDESILHALEVFAKKHIIFKQFDEFLNKDF